MSDFEKQHGEPLILSEDSAVVSFESVIAALTDVALEVKDGEEVFLMDKDGVIFRKQDDGAFHLKPKRDYVIMRRTSSQFSGERKGAPFSLFFHSFHLSKLHLPPVIQIQEGMYCAQLWRSVLRIESPN